MKVNDYGRLVRKEFVGDQIISKDQLLFFFRKWEPELKETTFRWRVHELRKLGVLQKVGRNGYSLMVKPVFFTQISDEGKKIFRRINREFQGIKVCIWNTESLSHLMLHQPARHMDVLETESDGLRPVYNSITHMPYASATIHGEYNFTFEFHKSDRGPLLVKSLISRAPMNWQSVEGYWMPTLEKILVDIFCEQQAFSAFAGAELAFIIDNAYNRYAIDFTRLLQYAERRNKSQEIKSLLIQAGIPKIVME